MNRCSGEYRTVVTSLSPGQQRFEFAFPDSPILERHGHPVTLLSEARVGCVIWEDDFQAIAEPFSNTRTR
jgi:hypothetical protein